MVLLFLLWQRDWELRELRFLNCSFIICGASLERLGSHEVMTKGRPTPGAGDPGAAGDGAHRSTRRSITLSPGHSPYTHKPYRDGLGPTIFTWLFSAEDQTSDARGASMGCELRCAPCCCTGESFTSQCFLLLKRHPQPLWNLDPIYLHTSQQGLAQPLLKSAILKSIM